METRSDAASYRISTCNGHGFFIFYESTKNEENKKFWVYTYYNVLMEEQWKVEIPFLDKLDFRKEYFDYPDLYMVFHTDEKQKESYNLQLLKLNIANGKYEVFASKIPDRSIIRDFRVYNETAYIGYNSDRNSGILSLHTLTRAESSHITNDSLVSELESIFIDTLNRSVRAIFNNYFSRESFYFSVENFTFELEPTGSIILETPEGRKYNTARMTGVGGEKFLIIGAYDNIKARDTDIRDYFSNESTGFFTVTMDDRGTGQPGFYNFLEFENITGYLKASEYLSARKKADKKGTEKMSLDYDLLIHNILEHNNTYYFIAEGFYEEYRTVTSTYYDYYGRPMPLSYSVFDGYRYFNGFVSCFDESGKMLWDNGMEIFNILTFNLKRMISVYFEGDETVLAYNRDGKIASKIISEDEVVEGVEYYPLEGSYTNDRVMEDSNSSMDYWYDNYFLCYGFQTIRNSSFVDREKRTVFYVNKVAFN